MFSLKFLRRLLSLEPLFHFLERMTPRSSVFRRLITAPPAPRKPTPTLISSIDTLVLDCDGVCYAHADAIPGVPECISRLKSIGKRIIFVTNSSRNSRVSLAEKLGKLGFENVSSEDCMTSASAAAAYLSKHHPHVKSAYFVGEMGLYDELALRGIKGLGIGDDGGYNKMITDKFHDEGLDTIGAVIVGMQVENLGYERLGKASVYARNRDRPFIGTNPDQVTPAGIDVLLPAAGAQLAYVSYAAEREPDVVVGKPSNDLANVIIDLYGLNPSRTVSKYIYMYMYMYIPR